MARKPRKTPTQATPEPEETPEEREVENGAVRKPGWQDVFLSELAKWGVVEWARDKADVHHSTLYDTRDRDPEFAEAWVAAKRKSLAQFEVVSRQRALLGTEKPIYYKGKRIDTIREVDNSFLRWILSKLDPETYGDKLTLGGDKDNPIQHNHTVDLESLSTTDLKDLVRIQRTVTKNGNGSGGSG